MVINMIVAIDKNGGIGNDNSIPWRLSKDMKIFRKLTKDSCVVMGKKTFSSIGKPLKNRTNIILTSKNINIDGVYIVNKISDALDIAKNQNKNIYVCGGASVYKSFFPLIDLLYITFVDAECKCDTKFMFGQKEINDGCLKKYQFDKIETVFEQEINDKNEYNSSMFLFKRYDI